MLPANLFLIVTYLILKVLMQESRKEVSLLCLVSQFPVLCCCASPGVSHMINLDVISCYNMKLHRCEDGVISLLKYLYLVLRATEEAQK